MKTYVKYSAVPSDDAFQTCDLAALLEIQRELANVSESTLQHSTDWGRNAYQTDVAGVFWAIAQAQAGQSVVVAQDDDGYYFATK